MSFNKAKFDRAAFDVSFASAIDSIKQSEEVTRREVRALSRTVLAALHCTENVGYLNTFLDALTPINRKAMVIYFQAFTGFHFDSKSESFTKKDKVLYAAKEAAALKFLEDPMNNFWSYAQREIKVEPKEFTLDIVTKATENLLKKAAKNHIKQEDVIRAMVKGGLTTESLIAVMGHMAIEEGKKGLPTRVAKEEATA